MRNQHIPPTDDRRPPDLIRPKRPEQWAGGSSSTICPFTVPTKIINAGQPDARPEADLLRPTGPEWVEGTILGDLRRASGNPVEIGKITVPQLQEEGFEFCDANQSRIASRDSDWEIEADNCGVSLSKFALILLMSPR